MKASSSGQQIKDIFLSKQGFLTSLVDNLPGFAYRCRYDEWWTMCFVTDQCHSVLGYEPLELIDNQKVSFNDLILPEFRQEVWRRWQKAVETRSRFEAEYQILTADGVEKWILERGIPIFDADGKVRFLEGYIEDINQRKKDELLQQILFDIANASMVSQDLHDLIRTIRQHLIKVVDAQNFYIALFDEESGMLSIPYESDEIDNIETWPAHKSVTGYVISQKKAVLLKKPDLERLVEEGVVDQVGYMCEVWMGVPLFSGDKAIGAIVVQDYGNPDAYGEDSKAVLEFVSHHISLSVQKQKSFEDLLKAKEKAEESDRLKSAFLANVSHEIRTPMNGVLGFMELLRKPDISEQKKNHYIDIVFQSGNRLLDTINDIIEIAQLDSGLMEVRPVESQLDGVMEFHHAFFMQQAAEKQIDFVLSDHLQGSEALFFLDKVKLDGILTNLLKNAMKFTPSGGRVSFGNTRKGDFLEFFVCDTGIGIPKNKQQAIFERFVQADLKYTRSYEGSGLGLSIVKAYVELLGGSIWLESEEDKGSCFYFTLPCNG